jgi:hypothetical protein
MPPSETKLPPGRRTNAQALRAVVSVHDVMPETLPAVETILTRLQTLGVAPITALVVPGRNWSPQQINWLREKQLEGIVLAGHGWYHHVARRRTLYHKLHGLILSRRVAEHLSLTESEVAGLIARCYDWFIEKGFSAPSLYVPPAWALGQIRRQTLDALPFRVYENLSGVYRIGDDRFVRLPLTGYEAEDPLRVAFLSGWNRLNELRARNTATALRLSIHPQDFSLGLAGQIEAQLKRTDSFLSYEQLFAA